MPIVDPKLWSVDNQQVRAKKGKLVVVKRGNALVKMYETDAIAQGLIKGKPQAENKMRVPAENKSAMDAPVEEKPQVDDFSTILGIGPASARALVVHGVTTFEQLKHATVNYLTTKAQDAIEDWKVANG